MWSCVYRCLCGGVCTGVCTCVCAEVCVPCVCAVCVQVYVWSCVYRCMCGGVCINMFAPRCVRPTHVLLYGITHVPYVSRILLLMVVHRVCVRSLVTLLQHDILPIIIEGHTIVFVFRISPLSAHRTTSVPTKAYL